MHPLFDGPARGAPDPPGPERSTPCPAPATGLGGEAGDVILGGLFKIVLAVLFVALALYEGGAIAVNHFQLDDLAGEAVRAGASTPPQQRTEATVERAVLAVLEGSDTQLDELEMGTEAVALTVSRPARVLVLDRIPFASGLVTARHSKRADFR